MAFSHDSGFAAADDELAPCSPSFWRSLERCDTWARDQAAGADEGDALMSLDQEEDEFKVGQASPSTCL